jgi:hypothetical protein
LTLETSAFQVESSQTQIGVDFSIRGNIIFDVPTSGWVVSLCSQGTQIYYRSHRLSTQRGLYVSTLGSARRTSKIHVKSGTCQCGGCSFDSRLSYNELLVISFFSPSKPKIQYSVCVCPYLRLWRSRHRPSILTTNLRDVDRKLTILLCTHPGEEGSVGSGTQLHRLCRLRTVRSRSTLLFI